MVSVTDMTGTNKLASGFLPVRELSAGWLTYSSGSDLHILSIIKNQYLLFLIATGCAEDAAFLYMWQECLRSYSSYTSNISFSWYYELHSQWPAMFNLMILLPPHTCTLNVILAIFFILSFCISGKHIVEHCGAYCFTQLYILMLLHV